VVPLSDEAWLIASARPKGGMNGDRTRTANEEWLSPLN
jgi:hypothetical protein